MSRINTNVQSLIAQRTLTQNNTNLGQSLERLSTGLRINRGKDDPAGLIASQRLDSETKALSAAISNANRADQVVNIARASSPTPPTPLACPTMKRRRTNSRSTRFSRPSTASRARRPSRASVCSTARWTTTPPPSLLAFPRTRSMARSSPAVHLLPCRPSSPSRPRPAASTSPRVPR
jgi:hypothetical protein